jgi:2-phospho-L-lactate guanylyltransferase
MKLWLIVPVKPLFEGKSRLASVLSPAERATLMRHLVRYVLDRAQQTGHFSELLVVSRDPEVWALAHLAGAGALREEGHDLNLALEQARGWAVRQQADAILVLPADLPLITRQDINQLVTMAQRQPGVLIAPSQGGGTSALLLRPPDAIPFCFGPESFRLHCQQAQLAGNPLTIYRSDTLAFDVDVPEDWAALSETVAAKPLTVSSPSPVHCFPNSL